MKILVTSAVTRVRVHDSCANPILKMARHESPNRRTHLQMDKLRTNHKGVFELQVGMLIARKRERARASGWPFRLHVGEPCSSSVFSPARHPSATIPSELFQDHRFRSVLRISTVCSPDPERVPPEARAGA